MSEIQSTETNKIAAAWILARLEIRHALLDSKNPHFQSKFASLESVLDALTPFLKHGLALFQTTDKIGSDLFVISTLTHAESGQWIRSYMPILAKDMSDPQKMGSGISYAKRYAAAMLGGIGERDDDGNKAAEPKPKETPIERGPVAKVKAQVKPKISEAAIEEGKAVAKAILPFNVPKHLKDRQVIDCSEFTAKFGQFKNKMLKDIPIKSLSDYSQWLKNERDKSGMPIPQYVEFVQYAEEFLTQAKSHDLDLALNQAKDNDSEVPDWAKEDIPF